MARAKEDRVIGDTTYRLTKLSATVASNVFFRLVGALQDLTNLEKVVSAMPVEMAYARDRFKESTDIVFAIPTQDGSSKQVTKPLAEVFDDHFVDNLGEFAAWMLASLEYNFGSFFVQLRQGRAGPLGPVWESVVFSLGKLGFQRTSVLGDSSSG